MDWLEVSVETVPEGLELVCGVLYQCGLTGLMIEDENDFREFLENPNREWDYIEEALVAQKSATGASITFFVTNNAIGNETLLTVKNSLNQLQKTETQFPLGTLCLQLKNVKEEDWANNWKKYFKPFPLGERLLIKPSWEALPEEYSTCERIVLQIDPGHIFGTGTHETTQLCLEAVEQSIKAGDTVLDIGCGSGILSIASLLLGAQSARAIDIDANAVEIAYENAALNHVDKDSYHVCAGDILNDPTLDTLLAQSKFDVVEANIVADIIIAICPKVMHYCKPDGIFIASGIIKARLEDVSQALLLHDFTIETIAQRGEWVAITARCRRTAHA